MTRLAFVSLRWPGGGVVGGAETLLGRLATHAASRGVAVDFLTTCARNHHTWTNDDPPGAFDAAPGLRVHRFPVSEARNLDTFLRIQERICRNQDVSPADQRAWMANSVHSPALYDHLRREGPHYHAILGGPYLFGVPHDALLIHPDRSWLVPCLHDESFAYQSIIRDLFHAVRGIIFNSEPEMELARRLYDIPAFKGTVVGMGLDAFTADPEKFAR
ncbi:MAG: glycosyltransferase, partial [Kiritimatiellia bacterium]